MSKSITKEQILDLIKGYNFRTEEEMEKYVVSKLPKLLEIKESQIERQFYTTNFDGRCSNRADIIIRSDDEIKVLLVIELKLSKSLEKYNDGNYEDSVKQLYKYAQDVRAPFGLLLTDISCHIFENRFYIKGRNYKRSDNDILPTIKELEKRVTFNCFIDFLICKYSLKYNLFIIFAYLLIVLFFIIFSTFFSHLLSSFFTGISLLLVGYLLSLLIVFIIVYFAVIFIFKIWQRMKLFD